jgi:hypothetical protein
MNVTEWRDGKKVTISCCVHTIINQRFSMEEMQFFFDHIGTYPLCSSCKVVFRKRMEEMREGNKTWTGKNSLKNAKPK